MEKLGIKSGTKLDLQIDTAGGNGAEYKSSMAQENGGGEFLISVPMKAGTACTMEPGTGLLISYVIGDNTYSLRGNVTGTAKKGPRTYLVLQADGPPQKQERRVFTRVAAELEAEIFVEEPGAGSRPYSALTLDISLGGLSLCTNAELPVGEVVSVAIPPRSEKITEKKEDLPLQAKVCWNRAAPKGLGFIHNVGVQFLFRNGEEIKNLERLFFSLPQGK
ncbi:MAG: flagellar brake protein [Oscillospiraceae bacterium]